MPLGRCESRHFPSFTGESMTRLPERSATVRRYSGTWPFTVRVPFSYVMVIASLSMVATEVPMS